MKLSKRTEYGLRALIALAACPAPDVLTVPQIARVHGISPKFLELVLCELRHHGLVRSRQGRGGGFSLAQSPAEVTIAAVVRALDDTFAPICGDRDRGDERCRCPDRSTCGLRLNMATIGDAFAAVLNQITLADIMPRAGDQTARLAGVPDDETTSLLGPLERPTVAAARSR